MNERELPVQIGRTNRLQVIRIVGIGAILAAGVYGEVLLPRRYAPSGLSHGDWLEVFLYVDSEDRFIATTETPFAMAGELAYLKVIAVTPVGAFLDWGLPKDLLVPFREQKEKMVLDRYYFVHVYFDEKSSRLVASSRVHKFLLEGNSDFSPGDSVELIICHPFEIGYNVIVNNRAPGVIYKNEIFQVVEPGQRCSGFIKALRDDGKIDVELQRSSDRRGMGLPDKICARLVAAGGFLPVTDKSPPEKIYELFQVSKKVYKKTVGALYREKRIVIADDGIRLV